MPSPKRLSAANETHSLSAANETHSLSAAKKHRPERSEQPKQNKKPTTPDILHPTRKPKPKTKIKENKINTPTTPQNRIEFILLMAAMSALDAFSIDAMLPALNQIGTDLGVEVNNQRQYVITALFLGFSIGVFFYGFVADWIGRRKPVMWGFIIFCIGSVACIFSTSFTVMLAGRVLQGVGAAGPYVLAIAIVRDSYKGEEMARTLSLIMMVFIGVPMIAPFIGQGFLLMFGWRSIFVALALFALIILFWFWLRQPESLHKQHRQSLNATTVWHSIIEVITHPVTARYLLIIGLLAGAFIAYLSTAQQIFQDMYKLGTKFPVVFASLAATFGIGSFVNSRLVEKFGAVTMVKLATGLIITACVLYLLVYHRFTELPPLAVHVAFNAVVVFSFAFLFGNTTSIAMQPMGHIAGAASSVLNSLSTVIAIVVATVIGAQLDQTGHPIVVGYFVCTSVALALVLLTPKAMPSDVAQPHQ